MAPLGDTLTQATDATQGVTDGATNNEVAPTDPAKKDVQGQRRGNTATKTEGSGPDGEKPSSLKIHIKLDLDVEVHLTARVKGDITIGLL